MRQAEAIPVTVEDAEAQRLLERLSPDLYRALVDLIEAARASVAVRSIVIRSIKSWEEPDWEELNFDVRVETESDSRRAYWDRIGQELDALLDRVSDDDRENLIKLVSVYVTPHGV